MVSTPFLNMSISSTYEMEKSFKSMIDYEQNKRT